MPSRIVQGIALLLTTAGCSPSEDRTISSEASMSEETPAIKPSAKSAARTAAVSTKQTKGDHAQISSRFLGIWDHVDSDCTAFSDMRLEIAPHQMTFYESGGRVSGVVVEGQDLLVDLEMSGEGENWSQVTRLSLSPDGAKLNLSDGTAAKTINGYQRKRCPLGPKQARK